jgi:hypothetical protein
VTLATAATCVAWPADADAVDDDGALNAKQTVIATRASVAMEPMGRCDVGLVMALSPVDLGGLIDEIETTPEPAPEHRQIDRSFVVRGPYVLSSARAT